MQTALVRLEAQFEGLPVNVLSYRGTNVWPARQVGRALGYSDGGGKFSERITQRWSDEFEVGTDFLKVQGDDLASFEQLGAPESGAPRHGGNRRDLLLLTESGIYLACLLTRKPAGRRLRRWLASEILPRLARGEGLPGADKRRPNAAAAEVIRTSINRLYRAGSISKKEWALGLAFAIQEAAGKDMPSLLADVERTAIEPPEPPPPESAENKALAYLEGKQRVRSSEMARELGMPRNAAGVLLRSLGWQRRKVYVGNYQRTWFYCRPSSN